MKITRRQLRQLIMESIPGLDIGMSKKKLRPEDPMMHVSPDIRKKLDPLINHDDESYQRQGHELATQLQSDMTVFPFEGDPYTRKPYEGDDYLGDLAKSASWQDEPVLIDGDGYGYKVKFAEVYANLKKAYAAIMRGDDLRSVKAKEMIADASYESDVYTEKIAYRLGVDPNKPSEKSDLYMKLFGKITRQSRGEPRTGFNL